MKHDGNVSKFLNIQVKRVAANGRGEKLDAQCEVVAIGCTPSKKKDPKGHSSGDELVLQKNFRAFKPLVDKLSAASEISPRAGAGCLIRFYGGVEGHTALGKHLLFVGTGKDGEGLNALGAIERLRRIGAQVMSKLQAEKVKDAAIHLDSFLLRENKLDTKPEDAAYAFAEGMGLSGYEFKKYLSGKKDAPKPMTVIFVASDAARANAFTKGVARAQGMLLGAEICRDLGNEPSNALYPEAYADRVKKMAAEFGIKCTVLDEKTQEKEKMGLLIGVGQGSVKPPRVIVLEYTPSKAKKTIAFVGKGITFDSGGISIKPSARMEDMKHDMCGSAAVVGATFAAAALKVPTKIITVVAAAENMPSGNAIQPGNILTARNGKTVEITNTDAEGRLVLADVLDWVQDKNPDCIIDLATLTGAATITLGKVCAGLMGNDRAFTRAIQAAADASGERVWELPLFDEYFDDLKSEYADMRNSGDTPAHGTAKGAMFLKQFIRKGQKWAHLDIASVAYGTGFIPYNPKKSSSGYGVRLLVELAKGL